VSYIDERVEEYVEDHTTPTGDLFERLAEETREKTTAPQMMVGRVEGKLLEFLVRATRAQLVLELGTFTGYSSISMARGLTGTGKVITFDVNPETTAIARRYAEEAGVAERIEYRLGPALDALPSLDDSFDLIFIDADKGNYVNYYEALLPRLKTNGLMLVDNTLWSGRVADDGSDDESTRAIRALNDRVCEDDRVEQVLLTVRDGILMIRKKS
jgi:predicted O-methyltransferase YrrM